MQDKIISLIQEIMGVINSNYKKYINNDATNPYYKHPKNIEHSINGVTAEEVREICNELDKLNIIVEVIGITDNIASLSINPSKYFYYKEDKSIVPRGNGNKPEYIRHFKNYCDHDEKHKPLPNCDDKHYMHSEYCPFCDTTEKNSPKYEKLLENKRMENRQLFDCKPVHSIIENSDTVYNTKELISIINNKIVEGIADSEEYEVTIDTLYRKEIDTKYVYIYYSKFCVSVSVNYEDFQYRIILRLYKDTRLPFAANESVPSTELISKPEHNKIVKHYKELLPFYELDGDIDLNWVNILVDDKNSTDKMAYTEFIAFAIFAGYYYNRRSSNSIEIVQTCITKLPSTEEESLEITEDYKYKIDMINSPFVKSYNNTICTILKIKELTTNKEANISKYKGNFYINNYIVKDRFLALIKNILRKVYDGK